MNATHCAIGVEEVLWDLSVHHDQAAGLQACAVRCGLRTGAAQRSCPQRMEAA
ncbi:MAG: hypothetical protein NZ750_09760 [Anaerolineae bacterium]|nr:hypothetical protein [Anaerolineae bacterium]MDW8171906.1 hypothetical protein [Anaerolineae bacterium]